MLGSFHSPCYLAPGGSGGRDVAGNLTFFLFGATATGGSATKAVEVLKEAGVAEERIIFVNLVSLTVEGLFKEKFFFFSGLTGST